MEVNVAAMATNVASSHFEVAQQLPNVAYPRKVALKEVDVAATITNVASNYLEVAQPPTNVADLKNVTPTPSLLSILHKIPTRTRPMCNQVHTIQHTRSTIFRI